MDKQITISKTDRQTDISFCLPVYNVDSYIEDCITSIVSQNFGNIVFEIICVNDCSTDNSLNVLKKMKQQFAQIRVIENDNNMGVSYCRNKCISEAKGKYIWFVDPDDMLYPNIIWCMYNFAEQNDADCLLGDYRRFSSNDEFESLSTESFEYSCTKSSDLPVDNNGKRMSAVWAGLFKREFLLNHKLKFNEKMIAQEDTLFYWELSLANPNRFKCNFPCYLYRQRSNSVMHSKNNDRAIKYYLSMREMLKVYQEQLETIPENKKDILLEKISHSHQNVATTLAAVTDTKYVREQFIDIKEKKIYPYKFRKSLLKGKISFSALFNYLMPIPIMFWILHFLYKIHRKFSLS